MTIYIAQIALLFVLWPLRKIQIKVAKKKSVDSIALTLMFVFLFLTMALRDKSVGTDTLGYSWVYEGIANANDFRTALTWSSISSSPIYVGIHYLVSRIIVNYQIAIAINSAVISLSFYYYIKNNSCDYCFSVFLFIALCMYSESMNGSRQFMAIGIALNAYSLIKENRKSKKGWILYIIALGIHNTIAAFMIAFLGIILKNRIKGSAKAFRLSVIISMAIALGFSLMINVFVRLFPYFNIYLDGTNGAQLFQNGGNGRIALLYFALGFFVFTTYFFMKKKNTDIVLTDTVDLFTCLVCVFLGIAFSRNILFNRILWPFLCVFIVFLPNCFRTLVRSNRQAMYSAAIVVLGAYCMWFLLEDKSSIVPYMTFWMAN